MIVENNDGLMTITRSTDWHVGILQTAADRHSQQSGQHAIDVLNHGGFTGVSFIDVADRLGPIGRVLAMHPDATNIGIVCDDTLVCPGMAEELRGWLAFVAKSREQAPSFIGMPLRLATRFHYRQRQKQEAGKSFACQVYCWAQREKLKIETAIMEG